MLDLVNLQKTFAKGTVNAHVGLDGLSLHLDKGEFVTILGSNGAGKSTLFNAICGSFLLDGGRVRLDGQDITFLPEHARARQIGRVFQDPMKGTAPGMTIEENLALAYTRAHSGPLLHGAEPQEVRALPRRTRPLRPGAGGPHEDARRPALGRAAAGGDRCLCARW